MEQPQKEEVVTGSASPAPTDHKRKHEDLEPESLETHRVTADTNGKSESHSAERGEEEDDLEAKRQRLEDKSDVSAAENGHQETSNYPEEVGVQPPVESTDGTEDPKQSAGADEQVNDEELIAQHDQPEATERTSDDNIKQEIAKTEASEVDSLKHPEEIQGPLVDKYQQEVIPSKENQDTSEAKTSRKMDVPNNKVGVLIGKAGDTIRYLQLNSGARIQITRDADADPYAGSRPVELIGTLESINKAEKLIKDVIAEADAGGSPSLVARGFNTAAGAGEQIQIQVPNEKVGVIIGKGGETIKSLQTRSGARIQLIPQHLPEGDQSKERTVRVTGDKKQIEMAREMIKEVMDQNARPSTASSGYNQQHPRDPATHWGSRGSHAAQQGGYDYQQRGPYQPHNQYPPQAYGNYPPQQMGPRSNFGWDRRPHGPNGGYDYCGGPGGHASDASKPIHTPAPGPSQPNYNYGQSPYSHMAPPGQSYGQGYNENNQAAVQHLYGGHGAPQQPSSYPQATAHPGYAQQDQYGRPPYGMPQQGPHVQSYGQPRAAEPGNMPYQGPISSTNPYAPAASTQQPYPYATGGQMQQAYPPYSSAPPADGYNQPLPTVAGPGYPQQGAQPVSGYGQPAGQPTPGYAQGGPTGGYAQYPTSQPGYAEQAAPNTAAAYGAYQGSENPAYSGAPASYGAQPVTQPIYSQPPPNQQQAYDQSVAQSGGYATAPATYAKGASPQPAAFPQYDASQMYGAQR